MNLMVFNFLSIVHCNITLPHRRVMLLCAEKRGRFIPCRGGGTDTTYYMDWHNVDEDMTTIPYLGGSWTFGTQAGIAYRDTDESPSAGSLDYVASSNMKN